MTPRRSSKVLTDHEPQRDVWQEVLDTVDEIKAGGGKRYVLTPQTAVARVRIQCGLSQGEFAALLGVSRRTIEQWEQGRRQPSGAAKTLIKIAESYPEILKLTFRNIHTANEVISRGADFLHKTNSMWYPKLDECGYQQPRFESAQRLRASD